MEPKVTRDKKSNEKMVSSHEITNQDHWFSTHTGLSPPNHQISILCSVKQWFTLILFTCTSNIHQNRDLKILFNAKSGSKWAGCAHFNISNQKPISISPTMEPEVIRDKEAMRKWSRAMRSQTKTIGLVPTMGYLHEGHLSLVHQSLTLTDVTVVSIYVNPGQFSPTEDLSTYPADFSGDLAKLAGISGGKVVVFNPINLYDYGCETKKINDGGDGKVLSCVEEGGLGHETWIRVERLEKGLCGKSRPVFFRGVATIVTKLFNIVEPDVAFFGKKDYQQWRIIQRMVRDLDFGIKIVGSDIAREKDGLAMSSRNVRLSDEERQRALSISKSLAMAKASVAEGKICCVELKDMIIQQLVESAGRVDYVEIVDQETLEGVEEIKSGVVICVAAWFGSVRLIDNIEINVSL